MNEEKVLRSCREILGFYTVDACLNTLRLELPEVMQAAALECFDNNRNDEHAEVIRQARKELAE